MKNNFFLGLGSWLAKLKKGSTSEQNEDFLFKHRLRRNVSDEKFYSPFSTWHLGRGAVGKFMVLIFALAFALAPLRPVLAASFLTLDSFSGNPGATLQVSGGGYQPGETISVYLGSSSTAAATATVQSNSLFGPVAVTVPLVTPQGPLPVRAVGGTSGTSESNSYYVVSFSASITVASTANTPGSTVSIDGTGFAPGETVNFTLNGQAGGHVTANSKGTFTGAAFVIPNVTPATYELHATGASSGADAINYFYVGGFYPSLTPSTYYVLPSQELAFSGSGFAAGETVRIFLDTTELSHFTAGSDGSFSNAGSVTIPMSYAGTAKIFRAVGDTTHGSASVEVTVGSFNPNVYPSSFYVLPGQSVNFSGGAFAPNETVDVFEGQSATPVATFKTDINGTYTNAGSITIPVDAQPGARTYRLVGRTSGGEVDATITVGQFNSLVSPALYHITAGNKETFSGTGFDPGESVDVFEGQSSTPLVTIVADSSGSFVNSGTTTIPFAWADSARTLKFVGRSSHTSATVTITVAPFEPQAGPSLYYVMPGDKIFFYGGGFGPGENIEVTQDQNPAVLLTISANGDGAFAKSGTITIPVNAPAGKTIYHLKGVSSGATTDVSITVGALMPQLSPSAYYLTPGQKFTVDGSGFAAGEQVDVAAGSAVPVAVTASSTGAFIGAGPFTAPLTGTSIHITATGKSSGASASVDVSLGSLYPSVSPSAWYVLPGSPVTFTASGFAPGETIAMASGQENVGTMTADEAGSATSTPYTIPFGSSGSREFTFTGSDSGARATVNITIAGLSPYADADTYYATPGSTVHVTGHGFASQEGVTISIGSNTVHATTDISGNTPATAIVIPFGSSNPVTITFSGDKSGATASLPITLAPFTPQVNPDTWYTQPGTTVHFDGTGFAAGETVNATLNGDAAGSTTTTASGTIASFGVKIPVSATTAHFAFTGQTSGAVAQVDVGLAGFTPQITPSAWYTPAGSKITFSGSGFAGGETVTISLNNAQVGTATTTDAGMFTSTPVTIPFSASSAHFTFSSSMTHVNSSLDIGVAALSPSVWLSTYYDQGGQPLKVFGSGFGGEEVVHVTFDGASLGDATTDAGGNFTLVSTVPFGSSGSKTIQAHGSSSGVSASATFTQPQVYVNVQLGSYAGAPGDAVTFIGSGFLPGEPIEVTTDRTGSTVVTSFTANATGSFSNDGWHIPATFTGGPVTLTVTGKHSFTSKSITYYVTGQ